MKPDQSRRVFEGKLISVDVERWGGHDARSSASRARSRSLQSTVMVGLRSSDSCASRHASACWSSPPGHGSRTRSRSQTAKRELIEEAGLGGGEWRLAATFFSTPGFCDELVSVYVAEGVEETERQPQEDEEIELVRVAVGELESLMPQIEDAKALVGLLFYLRER